MQSGDEWYCWLHAQNRPSGPYAEDDLRDVIGAQQRHIAERRVNVIDQHIESQIRDHPEWARREEETSTEYHQRMREVHERVKGSR